MSATISRRAVLRTSGVAAMVTLSGCQWENPISDAGHIYVENSSGQERRLAVVIAEQSEGALDFEIQAWYRIPAGHALQFEGVLEPDQRHVVRAALPGAPPEDRVTATIDQCSEEQSGERVVSIEVQPDGLGIVPRDCEAAYTQLELEYVQASEYQLESLDRELTTTPED